MIYMIYMFNARVALHNFAH